VEVNYIYANGIITLTELMKRIILIPLAVALVGLAAIYLFQDRLIFQSTTLPPHHVFSFDQPYQEFTITTPDREKLSVLWFTSGNHPKGVVLYFHGNAGNLQRWGHYAADLTTLGYDVVMMDYRGYGKSTGKPGEQVLYSDALIFWNWVQEKNHFGKMILYGRSLGAAVATELATHVQPDLLILETPFDRLRSATLARLWWKLAPMKYEFPTASYLSEVKCRKVIFHGTDDGVVPLESAGRLKPFLGEADRFIVIPEGGHANLREFPLYHTTLAEVMP
jgi:uncharacterized protein